MLRNAPTAALGGMQKFAADASIQVNFLKADIRIPFVTSGPFDGSVDKANFHLVV